MRALRRIAAQPIKPSPLTSSVRSSLRPAAWSPSAQLPRFVRPYSSAPSDPPAAPSKPLTSPPETQGPTITREARPEYELHFTCKPCGTRSKHNITKQAYHHGSCLVQCPECKNRHIIADHLGIFLDKKMTIEDLMREQGQLVKKGTLGQDGDLEFWPDQKQPSSQE